LLPETTIHLQIEKIAYPLRVALQNFLVLIFFSYQRFFQIIGCVVAKIYLLLQSAELFAVFDKQI